MTKYLWSHVCVNKINEIESLWIWHVCHIIRARGVQWGDILFLIINLLFFFLFVIHVIICYYDFFLFTYLLLYLVIFTHLYHVPLTASHSAEKLRPNPPSFWSCTRIQACCQCCEIRACVRKALCEQSNTLWCLECHMSTSIPAIVCVYWHSWRRGKEWISMAIGSWKRL